MKLQKHIIWLTGLAILLVFCTVPPNQAQAADNWENEVSLYGWLTDISGSVGNGTEFTYDLEDIVDSMQMVLMGGYEGRIDKFSVIADMVYLSVGDEADITVPAGNARVDADLTSLVLSAAVGYDLVQSDTVRFAVVAGVRYIDMELETDMTIGGTEVPRASGSQDMLDGTIGVRGYLSFGNNWFLPYYADIGTGDSELSYQLFGGIGYSFGWGDVRIGYRHLCIEMEDDKLMEDLTISGPVLGVGFRF